jgi:hypothetical protein
MAKQPSSAKGRARKLQPGEINIAMEGDSWFRLPNFPIKLATVGGADYDVERGLRALGYLPRNNAYWGDTCETMAALGSTGLASYWDVLSGWHPHVFMLSAGGNDLLGAKTGTTGRLAEFLHQRPSGPNSWRAKDYLSAEYDRAVRRVMGFYRIIFNDVLTRPDTAKVKILVHGYDYVRPMGLVWLTEPFDFRNIDDGFRPQILKLAIDRFNDALSALANEYAGKVHYVSLRTVVKNDWHDELHPTAAGFDRICAVFADTIRRVL